MKRLYTVYPQPKVELNFTTPFELLVATILAAQATDKLVNTTTPILFATYSTIQDMANASIEDIDKIIAKITFHRNKAKNIQAAAQMIVETYGGEVPQTMEDLDALPGVARKTANVVLGNAFGIQEGIATDTHVIRLSHRLGLSEEKDPIKIERDLMELIPQKHWTDFSNMLTLHGRYKCIARLHLCDDCPLGDLCPEYLEKL